MCHYECIAKLGTVPNFYCPNFYSAFYVIANGVWQSHTEIMPLNFGSLFLPDYCFIPPVAQLSDTCRLRASVKGQSEKSRLGFDE